MINQENVKKIIKEINPVKLVAATKYGDLEDLYALEEAGVKIFGENRVQAFLEKYENYQGKVKWHFIGTLQTNKVKYIVGKVDLIHSVDSLKLLKTIDKEALKNNIIQNVLIQVNIAKETSKHGFNQENIDDVFKQLNQYPNTRVQGLMMMAPNDTADNIEKYFIETNQLLKKLQKIYPDYNLELLSMGMSNDYQIAIKYGANLVRIGSALFK